MAKCLLAKKIGMTQRINEDGSVDPVTVLESNSCVVINVKTQEQDGYQAVLLGFDALAEKKCNKPMAGYFKKYEVAPRKYLKEFRVDSLDGFVAKSALEVSVFEPNDLVKVKSRSIGKGFAGTIKRHNFRRGPMSHGSKSHRIPGSIGCHTYPGRVLKGKRMAGHLGDEWVTVSNLKVVAIDAEKSLLFVKGAVPGKPGAIVQVFN